jgi:potassium channel subfamily K, other eukaryote
MANYSTITETSPLFNGKNEGNSPQQPPATSYFFSFPRWDIIALVMYFTMGVTFYCTEEQMPFIRALYFCIITFTTVGFGDFSPSTTACKLFTCMFVFVGLAIIATLVSNLLDYIVEKREILKKEKLQETFDQQDTALLLQRVLEKPRYECFALFSFESYFPSFAAPIVHGLKQSFIIISMNIFVGIMFYAFIVDNYSLIDAFYLSCMTITTVGYGDITPTNNYARAFTVFYALLGTLVTGNALSKFASAISDYKQAKLEATVLARPLNHASLMAMDSDKTNIGVSMEEFVLYKLKVMGALDEDIVQRAEAQFHRLDITKSGYLSVKDIVLFEEKVKRVALQRSNSPDIIV